MRYSNLIGIVAALLIVVISYLPWVTIDSIPLTVTGMGASVKTVFGKPALMNFWMLGLCVVFFLIPKIWAKRINPFVAAINFAWALRNLLLLSTCRNGECPSKHPWLYVYFALSLLVLIMAILPDVKEKKQL
jgi:hypothetical protein